MFGIVIKEGVILGVSRGNIRRNRGDPLVFVSHCQPSFGSLSGYMLLDLRDLSRHSLREHQSRWTFLQIPLGCHITAPICP
jgi:hypothetical protein